MFHPPRGIPTPGPQVLPERELPVRPPPVEVPVVDPQPWIDVVLPPDDEKRPPPAAPPVVVIQPVEVPPTIMPPLPDMTPPTIVPPEFETPIPDPLPLPPMGIIPTVRPPPSLVIASAVGGLGTFMVYVGRKLVLTMAASLGTSLGKSAGAMLVGAVNKQLFRGTSIRFHSGQSFGLDPRQSASRSAVSYEQAWRMAPQEFSYWEA